MTQNNDLNDAVIDSPELRAINQSILVSRIHRQFPEVSSEVITKIVSLVTDKDVLMNSGNPLETLPAVVELTLKSLFNVR